MSLSDEIYPDAGGYLVIPKVKVKEFIKELKERMEDEQFGVKTWLIIDELTGKELV